MQVGKQDVGEPDEPDLVSRSKALIDAQHHGNWLRTAGLPGLVLLGDHALLYDRSVGSPSEHERDPIPLVMLQDHA